MQTRIEQLVREKYPQFDIQPFTKAAVERAPIVLVGTFTPVNKEGKTEGTREAYRICLALADFKSGKVISKGTARAQMGGVDVTPTAYFRDSPTWAKEAATEGYIKTCQGTKPGDPINPVYIERITAAALINEAIEAYNSARYEEALGYYTNVLRTPGGDQLRAHNGIYMTNWQLGRYDAAAESFGQIVDYGITNKRLAVKFLFKPRSTAFWPDQRVTKPYPIWLKQIARHAVQRDACLEISGHTSPTGPEPLNEQLSLRRAEYIQKRLEAQAPELRGRTLTDGKGSRENLVGTGKDDVTDALDRRVVFVVIDCAGGTVTAPLKTAAVMGY
jgi:outer membrane protein OmpA-like peptidoglycan-associated protein